jgi:hypothetical protein
MKLLLKYEGSLREASVKKNFEGSDLRVLICGDQVACIYDGSKLLFVLKSPGLWSIEAL